MNLSDIIFVDADTDTAKSELITKYESLTGRSLASGDPVRLFLESVASEHSQLKALINFTGRMNLLAYAKGDYLDHLGVLVDTDRLAAQTATTTLQFTLSAAQSFAVTIPAGTRVTSEERKIYFSTDEKLTILAGATLGTVSASCTQSGAEGNGYLPGQLKLIVDPVAYVATASNITTSAGGADTESDDAYRDRIHIAPESFSCAGPDGAYEYWAKTASALISDVMVTSPTPGEVHIYPLLSGGGLPSEEILADVVQICSSRKIRPLTDHVSVLSPGTVEYTLAVTYYVANENATRAAAIQKQVSKAVEDYVLWQRSKLGRDIDPSKLYAMIVSAGGIKVAVSSPTAAGVAPTEVAVLAGTPAVTYGGIVDE